MRRVLADPANRQIVRELVAAQKALDAANEQRSVAAERRRAAVEAARGRGATWEEVREILGLESRQAAEAIVAKPRRAGRRSGG